MTRQVDMAKPGLRAGLMGAKAAMAARVAGGLLFLATAGSCLAIDPDESVRTLVQAEAARFPGRVELDIGKIDERVKLASCARSEPFIPQGSRLWGRTHLGVRCRDGAQWSVLIPVVVKIFAPALIASKPLSLGMELTEDAFRIEEVELTREAPGILTDAAMVAGQLVARPVAAGAPLRRDHFRPKPAVAPGDQVRLTYSGPGFSVTSSGKALQAGLEGQTVRIQLESGRILSGIARQGRLVEVGF
jgi:flagellar basal body P-ring formation protein FlgA